MAKGFKDPDNLKKLRKASEAIEKKRRSRKLAKNIKKDPRKEFTADDIRESKRKKTKVKTDRFKKLQSNTRLTADRYPRSSRKSGDGFKLGKRTKPKGKSPIDKSIKAGKQVSTKVRKFADVPALFKKTSKRKVAGKIARKAAFKALKIGTGIGAAHEVLEAIAPSEIDSSQTLTPAQMERLKVPEGNVEEKLSSEQLTEIANTPVKKENLPEAPQRYPAEDVKDQLKVASSKAAASLIEDKESTEKIIKKIPDLAKKTGEKISKKDQKEVEGIIRDPNKLSKVAKATNEGKEAKGVSGQFVQGILPLIAMAAGFVLEGREGAVAAGKGALAGQAQADASAFKREQLQATQDIEAAKLESAESIAQEKISSQEKMAQAQLQQERNIVDYKARTTLLGLTKKQEAEDQALYVPNVGIARNADDAKELKAAFLKHSAATNLLTQLKALGTDVNLTDASRVSQIASLREQLKGALREQIVGPGAMSEADAAILDKVIADPSALFRRESTELAKIDNLMANLNHSMDTQKSLRTKDYEKRKQIYLQEKKRREKKGL